MIIISNYLLPIITIYIIIYALIKKINIYNSFINGVKEGLIISLDIFPSIFAMIVSVTILIKSNILLDISKNITLKFIPKEILPLALLRPVSSSSSIMLLNNLLSTNGVDSIVGKIGSIITGSTDTTIYIISLYLGSINIKKTKYSLIVCLFADLICIITSILIVKIL